MTNPDSFAAIEAERTRFRTRHTVVYVVVFAANLALAAGIYTSNSRDTRSLLIHFLTGVNLVMVASHIWAIRRFKRLDNRAEALAQMRVPHT